VAMDADGDFVVAWSTIAQDDSGGNIAARRFSAAGVALGGEFRVNTYVNDFQGTPSVARNAAGDFVIAWNSYGQDGSSFGAYAQLYNAAGQRQGGEFRVNTFTADEQSAWSVAMDAAGNFVVAWNSIGQDGEGADVYAQRYDASGRELGGEFRVNATTADSQFGVIVAADADGDLIFTWASVGQDGSGHGIYARRFTAAGVPIGGEFRVNTTTAGDQLNPAVATDADGGFVISWEGAPRVGGPPGPTGWVIDPFSYPLDSRVAVDSAAAAGEVPKFVIYAQRYGAAAQPIGGEVRVDTDSAGNQRFPSVALDADGDFIIAWASAGRDGAGRGVYARRFAAANVITPVRAEQVFVNSRDLTGGTPTPEQLLFRALAGVDAAFGYSLPAGAAQDRSIPWSNGINSVSIRFSRDVANQVERGDLSIRGINRATYAASAFAYDSATRTATWTLPSPVVNDTLRLFLDDGGVGGLDGEWQNGSGAENYPSGDGSEGGDFDFVVHVLAGDANGDGRVNALDLALIKQRLNRKAGNPGTGAAAYSVFADVTADGIINALDLGTVKGQLNARLPGTGAIATAVPTPGASATLRRTATDDLYSSLRIL
jgi:hypothetical protein